ncbi:ATP-binding protein (plasmid) [Streptomyces sp. CA-142005]|uniref:ATP-binding protein n=1 Tax=Streptomyces sp. CA-142005 TaxID=3240052 RepID=UPI003D8C9026
MMCSARTAAAAASWWCRTSGEDSWVVAHAREASHRFATRLGWPAEACDDLVLIVSELVTNACRHAPGPCRLHLEAVLGGITVEVWDTNPLVPPMGVRATPLPGTCEVPCGGYGLGIVALLCQELRGFAAPHGGKTIRALVAWPAACEQRRDEHGANGPCSARTLAPLPVLAALPSGARLVPGPRVRPARTGRYVLQSCHPAPRRHCRPRRSHRRAGLLPTTG